MEKIKNWDRKEKITKLSDKINSIKVRIDAANELIKKEKDPLLKASLESTRNHLYDKLAKSMIKLEAINKES